MAGGMRKRSDCFRTSPRELIGNTLQPREGLTGSTPCIHMGLPFSIPFADTTSLRNCLGERSSHQTATTSSGVAAPSQLTSRGPSHFNGDHGDRGAPPADRRTSSRIWTLSVAGISIHNSRLYLPEHQFEAIATCSRCGTKPVEVHIPTGTVGSLCQKCCPACRQSGAKWMQDRTLEKARGWIQSVLESARCAQRPLCDSRTW
jgi:hypothetical protein